MRLADTTKTLINVGKNILHSSGKAVDKSDVLTLSSLENTEEKDKQMHEPFLTPFDIEVLESLETSHNSVAELFRISLPAFLSLALCPVTLFMYEPLTTFFWPKDKFSSPPDISDAISCFLAPAGLVYATSFGFAFQSALNKQHEILTKMTNEISMIDQIATFAAKLNLPKPSQRIEILEAIKAEAIFMILQILNRDPSTYVNKSPDDIQSKKLYFFIIGRRSRIANNSEMS